MYPIAVSSPSLAIPCTVNQCASIPTYLMQLSLPAFFLFAFGPIRLNSLSVSAIAEAGNFAPMEDSA